MVEFVPFFFVKMIRYTRAHNGQKYMNMPSVQTWTGMVLDQRQPVHMIHLWKGYCWQVMVLMDRSPDSINRVLIPNTMLLACPSVSQQRDEHSVTCVLNL